MMVTEKPNVSTHNLFLSCGGLDKLSQELTSIDADAALAGLVFDAPVVDLFWRKITSLLVEFRHRGSHARMARAEASTVFVFSIFAVNLVSGLQLSETEKRTTNSFIVGFKQSYDFVFGPFSH